MSRVLSTAQKLSWKKGTPKKKYAFKGGNPTKAYIAAYKKAFGKYSREKSSNCDRSLALVFRLLGYKVPTGNEDQLKYKTKKLKVIVKKNARPYDIARPGDGIVVRKKNGHRHSYFMGEEKICLYEAQHHKTFFHRNRSAKKSKAKQPKVVIFREK